MWRRPTATVALVVTHLLRGIQQHSRVLVAAQAKLLGATTNVMVLAGTPHDHRAVRVQARVVLQVLVVKVVLVTRTTQAQVLQRRRVGTVFPAALREQTSAVVAAVVAGVPVALQAVQEAELVVVRVQPVAQVRPTPVAVAVAALSDVYLVALAVRALSLCVTQTCPLFRANPLRARCRLVRRPHSQSLLQQRVQPFRISGKKMVLIFQAQQGRVTPLLLQWSVTQARIALWCVTLVRVQQCRR